MISNGSQSLKTDRTSNGWLVPFIVALFAMFALQMSILGYAPLLPQIVHEFKFSYTELGLFTGAYGLISLLFSVPAGVAIHRFNEKRVLFLGLVVTCLGLGFMSAASGVVSAFIALSIWFTGYRFAFVAVLAALAFVCPPAWRGRSFGILGAISSFGVIIGAPFSGYLAKLSGWRSAFQAFTCVAAVMALVCLVLYHRKQNAVNEPSHADSNAVDKPAKRSAYRMPRVWALAVVVGMTGLPSFGITFFVPSAAKSLFSMDAVSVGFLLSAGYVVAVVTNLLGGYLMDRFDKWLVLGFVELLMIPAAMLLYVQSLTVFRICTIAIIALSFTATNQGYGLAGDVVRGSQTANVMGIISLGSGVFGYMGPQLLGILRDAFGTFTAGWYFIAFIAAATALGAFLLRKVRWETPQLASSVRQTHQATPGENIRGVEEIL